MNMLRQALPVGLSLALGVTAAGCTTSSSSSSGSSSSSSSGSGLCGDVSTAFTPEVSAPAANSLTAMFGTNPERTYDLAGVTFPSAPTADWKFQLIYVDSNNAANQIHLALGDVAPGVCPWSFQPGGMTPPGHYNVVHVINNGQAFSYTEDDTCRLVVTDGHDATALSDTVQGYSNRCRVNSETGTSYISLIIRYAATVERLACDTTTTPFATNLSLTGVDSLTVVRDNGAEVNLPLAGVERSPGDGTWSLQMTYGGPGSDLVMVFLKSVDVGVCSCALPPTIPAGSIGAGINFLDGNLNAWLTLPAGLDCSLAITNAWDGQTGDVVAGHSNVCTLTMPNGTDTTQVALRFSATVPDLPDGGM